MENVKWRRRNLRVWILDQYQGKKSQNCEFHVWNRELKIIDCVIKTKDSIVFLKHLKAIKYC